MLESKLIDLTSSGYTTVHASQCGNSIIRIENCIKTSY
jgi:hypothetical protein